MRFCFAWLLFIFLFLVYNSKGLFLPLLYFYSYSEVPILRFHFESSVEIISFPRQCAWIPYFVPVGIIFTVCGDV